MLLRSILITYLIFSFIHSAHARTFQAEGSDLMMGVGAENIALAGAVVASTDDVYASFWNPAGLSQLNGFSGSYAKQLNAKLIPNNFIGIASSSSLLHAYGLDSGFAFAFIPRLHIKASGTFRDDEFESILIRYALPGLPSNFTGNMESKTKDHRFSFGIAPSKNAKWRFGMALSYIECGTSFCGVFAEDPGNYTFASANASAWAVHMGAKYHYSKNMTFAFNLKDFNTTLDVETVITDNEGTRTQIFHAKLPRDFSFGITWQYAPHIQLSTNLQYMFGRYGNYDIDFRFWRNGLSYQAGDWSYRGGVLVPLRLQSDRISEIDPPAPFMPTMGFGWTNKHINIDLALYAHPVMSQQQNSPYPAADVSISAHF